MIKGFKQETAGILKQSHLSILIFRKHFFLSYNVCAQFDIFDFSLQNLGVWWIAEISLEAPGESHVRLPRYFLKTRLHLTPLPSLKHNCDFFPMAVHAPRFKSVVQWVSFVKSLSWQQRLEKPHPTRSLSGHVEETSSNRWPSSQQEEEKH